jgi:REP element-mobilizing transposase RayT
LYYEKTFANLDEFIVMPNHIYGIIEIYKSQNCRAAAESLVFLSIAFVNKARDVL